MTVRRVTSDRAFGASLCASIVCHILCGAVLVWWQTMAPPPLVQQETYYVDVVNLPVASPRAGSPTQQGDAAEAAPPLPGVEEQPMAVPPPTQRKPADSGKEDKPVKPVLRTRPDMDSGSFDKSFSRLKEKVAAGQHEAALERLRRKVASGGSGSGRSGMPDGTGREAGSDYVAYIQSRLKDAFRDTISYTSSAPEVVVRISLDSSGRLARKKIERSSGDLTFERSVFAAIDRASEKFPPPPAGKGFEGVFKFRPQGISNSRQ